MFDTFLDPDGRRRGWRRFVGRLPEGTLVAGAVRDEASHRLTEEPSPRSGRSASPAICGVTSGNPTSSSG